MLRFLTFLTFIFSVTVMSGDTSGRIIDRHDSKEKPRKTINSFEKSSKEGNDQPMVLRLPTVITEYRWIDGAWDTENANIERYTYNEDGSVATRIWGSSRTEYSYDAFGRESGFKRFETYDGEEYLSSEVEYSYDSIVTDFITAAMVKYGDSESASGYGTEITRNEDGNVIKIRRYFEMDGEKSYDWDWVSIEYGQDGKAIAMAKKAGYPGEEGMIEFISDWHLTDIVWENTNGQILFEDINLEDPLSNWYFGENRIKSAVIIDDSWQNPVYFSVEYDNDGHHSRFVMDNELIGEIVFQTMGGIRNYHYESHMQMLSYDWEGNPLPTIIHDISTCLSDRFGLTIEYEYKSMRRHGSEEEETENYHYNYQGDITYDSYGYPIEILGTEYEYSEETEEFTNRTLTIFSDYVDCSADVTAIESNVGGKPEYFNLQGVKVEAPSNGIYIRRQGSTFTKVAF